MSVMEMTCEAEVHLGCVVSFTDRNVGHRQTFTLVSPLEAAPTEGRLSIISPIGRALVGHRVGDLVAVPTPRGVRPLLISEIG